MAEPRTAWDSQDRKCALLTEPPRWSITWPREKLVKIGARMVRHGQYDLSRLHEAAVPRGLFAVILRQPDDLSNRRTFFAVLWQTPQWLRTVHETIKLRRGAYPSWSDAPWRGPAKRPEWSRMKLLATAG